jgi:hypothetical protein
MTKGIIIIATASHIYGRMAYNLALTIKATGTQVPVCLVHDQAAVGHLSTSQLALFDTRIEREWSWNQIRFNIDQLTPYELTLQLDADMLWLWRDPAVLLDQYADVELLVTNEGYFDIETGEEHLTGAYQWLADRDKTVAKYGLKGKLYQMRWELLLFRKTDRVRKMFAEAEKIRRKPKLKTWLFEGAPVDEFAFYVSANLQGLDQLQAPFLPAYWCHRSYNPTVAELDRKYFAIGFGGNNASREYKRIYDLIMTLAAQKMGVQHLFRLQSKNHYLTSRIAI